MNVIAVVPGMLAFLVGMTKGPWHAFIGVYLPTLLLLPEYYRFIAPGLPDPTFSQGAAMAVGISWIARGTPGWKASFPDFLVFGFAATIFYSEFRAAGYKEAQNLLFDMLGWVVFPYLLSKSLVEPFERRVVFAKRIVILVLIVSIVAVQEFLLGMNPYRLILDPFFPGQGRGWVTTFRWGFARVAGPYAHAILAGVILICAFRLARWLQWEKHWPPNLPGLKGVPISVGAVVTLGVLGGVIMSMVRGPWIGGIMAAALIAVGRSKQRVVAIAAGLAFFVFVGLPVIIGFINYASVGRENAKTVAQESAAYRYELIENYLEIASEKLYFGWGRNTWPKVPGQPSIDNYYLLLTLMHGVVATGLLLAIFLTAMVRLLRKALGLPLEQGTFAFTLLSLYAAVGFSIATVFLGLTTMPFVFMITGWAEGYVLFGHHRSGDGEEEVTAPAPTNAFGFQRVLA